MKPLKNNSGVSLIFVLGAMALLLIIGVSAFTAAGLNAGAYVRQRERNQLNMYQSSMERTLKAALEAEFGDWILEKIFAEFSVEAEESAPPGETILADEPFEIEIEPALPDSIDAEFGITASGSMNARTLVQPGHVEVWGRLKAELKTAYGESSSESETVYRFNGGIFMNNNIVNSGKWTVERHETGF